MLRARVQSGRGPCSPCGFHGARHISREIRPCGPGQGTGGSLTANWVPGPGCLLWPWWGQVALGHRKQTNAVLAWPPGTRSWNWVPCLGADHRCPSWGPASHTAHGFCWVREPGASARRLVVGLVHLGLWQSLQVTWAAGSQVVCPVVCAAPCAWQQASLRRLGAHFSQPRAGS